MSNKLYLIFNSHMQAVMRSSETSFYVLSDKKILLKKIFIYSRGAEDEENLFEPQKHKENLAYAKP